MLRAPLQSVLAGVIAMPENRAAFPQRPFEKPPSTPAPFSL